MIVRFFRLST